MDTTKEAPEQQGTEEGRVLWPLPFPLPPRDEWLEVEQQQGKREQIYRSGNIALRVLDGMVVGVCVHRVWLVPSDVYALWQLLAAVLQTGAALWPGVRQTAMWLSPRSCG